jgi:hypothetical protein
MSDALGAVSGEKNVSMSPPTVTYGGVLNVGRIDGFECERLPIGAERARKYVDGEGDGETKDAASTVPGVTPDADLPDIFARAGV